MHNALTREKAPFPTHRNKEKIHPTTKHRQAPQKRAPKTPYTLNRNPPPTQAPTPTTRLKHPLPPLPTRSKPPAPYSPRPTPNRKHTPLDTPTPPSKPNQAPYTPTHQVKQTHTQPHRKKQHPQDTENPRLLDQHEEQTGETLCLTMINTVTNPKRECTTSLTQNTQPHQRKNQPP